MTRRPFAALALVVLLGCSSGVAKGPTTVLLRATDGTNTTLASLEGTPLVVNLWYSTCQPCKREMPAIETTFQKYSDRVRFIGVNTLDSVDTTASFARELGVTYELARDPDGNLTSAAGVANFPMTFFVSADGTVIRQISGEMRADDLESAIAELLPGAMNP